MTMDNQIIQAIQEYRGGKTLSLKLISTSSLLQCVKTKHENIIPGIFTCALNTGCTNLVIIFTLQATCLRKLDSLGRKWKKKKIGWPKKKKIFFSFLVCVKTCLCCKRHSEFSPFGSLEWKFSRFTCFELPVWKNKNILQTIPFFFLWKMGWKYFSSLSWAALWSPELVVKLEDPLAWPGDFPLLSVALVFFFEVVMWRKTPPESVFSFQLSHCCLGDSSSWQRVRVIAAPEQHRWDF